MHLSQGPPALGATALLHADLKTYTQQTACSSGQWQQPCLVILLCQNGMSHMQVNVINDIPADFPSAADGISIHWHGFSMRGNEWYDGTGHIAQCPILPGASFTYYFQVSHTDDLRMSSCVKCFSRCHILQGNCQCAGLGFCNSACCSKSCPCIAGRSWLSCQHLLHQLSTICIAIVRHNMGSFLSL